MSVKFCDWLLVNEGLSHSAEVGTGTWAMNIQGFGCLIRVMSRFVYLDGYGNTSIKTTRGAESITKMPGLYFNSEGDFEQC